MPQDINAIVQRMVEAGEPEENIALVIQHYKAPAPAAQMPQQSMADGFLADTPSAPLPIRAGQLLGRMIKAHPVESAATGGAMLAAPFTGGGSILGGMAAAGLGAAGGAGAAIAGRQLLTGRPEPAAQTLGTMAEQGIANAAGEGIGRGVVAGANLVVPKILKGILRPYKGVQQEFGDVVGTMRKERIPVGRSDVAGARMDESVQKVDEIIKAKDAQRPKVAGYLPPAKESIPLGNPQTTMPKGTGVMVGKVINKPGRGAYPGQVDPREVVTGLGKTRGQLGNRALDTRALDELSGLEKEFLDSHFNPMSLTETQALKRAEQKLANTAFRAQSAGNPINEVSANFHKGMAGGAQRAIERQAPEVIPHNARAQEMMGLEQALMDAEARSGGVVGLNPANWASGIAPGLGSSVTFAADAAAQGTQGTTARLLRQALLSMLAGESQQ